MLVWFSTLWLRVFCLAVGILLMLPPNWCCMLGAVSCCVPIAVAAEDSSEKQKKTCCCCTEEPNDPIPESSPVPPDSCPMPCCQAAPPVVVLSDGSSWIDATLPSQAVTPMLVADLYPFTTRAADDAISCPPLRILHCCWLC